ncbi:Calx-beta domain-containing protein [Arcobacter vandammei]|uniref:Calx-beta domain-containing protein n=1 Tax=Arcobacter vandammei TaxID=2782243 RepID=UPI0018DFE045|nr:Calx-beta domain-containing protein [Arcobacter vandammei]
MATQAGIVQSLQSGKFFVKDELGNIKELKQGDIINENDTVYGDSSNSSSSKIEILLDGNDVIVLMQGQQQLIDSSLIETAFGSEELFFTRGDLEQILEAHRAMTDIESDLRDAKFKGDKNITEEETTEGQEEVEDEESSASQFAARTGAMTDIESDLRKKLFSSSINLRKEENALGNDFKLPKSQSYSEAQNNFNNQTNNNKPLGERPSNPFEKPTYPTTPPTRPNTDKPTEEPDRPTSEVRPDEPKPDVKPPVTPPPAPESAAKLSIDDQIIWEQDGKMWFTVTLDKPLSGDVTFTYKTSSGTATEGKDYIGKTGTITIPAGSTSVKIPVDILDDFFYEKSEYFNIDITNITGNINKNDSKTHGIGTILDNPPVKDSPITPNSPDSSTGSYGEEDTVYAIITGDPTVKEGDKSGYIVKLVDKDGNPVVVDENTDVTVVYKNITTQDNDTQYKNGDKITITIPKGSNQATFIVETKDDFYADNGEKFNLSIEKVDTNEFENVVIGDKYGNNKDVTTEILDNTTTNPNNPSTVEPNQEQVILKIVAADKDGNPIIKDGKYVFANEVPEGSDAKYKVLAFAPNTTEFKTTDKLDIQGGKVTIKTENGSANGVSNQTKIDGSEDYKTTQIEVDLDSVISVETFDDYLKDGGETFNVVIVDNSYKHPTTPVYENVKTDTKPVTTTITDNPSKIDQPDTSTNPDDKTTGIYDQTDTVYAVITGTQTIKEGDESTAYTVKLVDKNGNTVIPTKDTKITVTYNNISTQDEDTQYKNGDTIEVTIPANSSEITFTVKTNDDVYKDNNEQFNLTITNIENTGEFENVKIGDKNGNDKNVISTITDNTNTGTEANIDPVNIVLVALEKGQTLVDITDSNGKLIYKNTNTTPESGKLYYIAVAVDKDDKVLVQSGQVTVNTANGTATGHNNPTKIDGSEDYKSLVNKPINIGEVFEVETNDDYLREDSEAFTVKITDVVNTNYETPTIDTTKDTVTSTITDNPAKVEQPDIGTGEDNPTTGNYGKDDTVYVKISETPSVDEGGNLVHTVTLVDKNGVEVKVPAGESVTVNLTYSANTGSFTEDDLSTIVKTVTITGGNSSQNFTNISIVDNKVEGTEKYNVTIGSVTQSGAFENVAIHTDKTTTGEIKDNPVKIVLVATDSSGNVPLDSDGKVDLSKNTNQTPEGGKLYYIAVAIDSNGKPLDVQAGKVNVSYGATPDNGTTDDYTKQTGKETQVTIGEVFEVTAKDDYFAEGNENFDVVISNPTNTPYVTPSIVQDKVTSTITDNPASKDTSTTPPTTPTEPTSPTDSTVKYGEEDTVYVVITGDQSKLEGEELLHNLKLVDKNGVEISIPTGETITVTLRYTSDTNLENSDFKTGENQYSKNGTITVELDSNGKATIKNKSEIDSFVEGSEKYTLSIDKITQDKGVFENIQAGYSDSYKTANSVALAGKDGTSVTGTISDNAVKIVLVAVTKDDINVDGTVKKDNIIKADGTVDVDKNTNQTPEGGKLYYVAVAIDSNGKPLDKQAGNLAVSYGTTLVSTDKDASLSGTDTDIANNPTTAEIGKVFTVDAKDDFYAEGDEKFEVTISNPDSTAQSTYGNNVSVDTTKNKVTSTITDNPANKDTSTPTTPTEPTSPTNSTPKYGEEDTVYVVITGDDTKYEGETLTHTIKLVDKDGNPVTIPAGEEITVTINYTGSATEGTDYTGTKTVTFTSVTGSTQTISNPTLDDYFADNNESYTATIGKITQKDGVFENIEAGYSQSYKTANSLGADAGKSVTGTILDDTDNTPNIPTDGGTKEPTKDQVILKIVAVDKDGNPILKNGNYMDISEVNEGDKAYYKVFAFAPNTTTFNDSTKVTVQGGTVTVSTENISGGAVGISVSQNTLNGTQDYTSQSTVVVTVGTTVFEVQTLDDYKAETETNETFKVNIDTNSYKHPSDNVANAIYENVTIDNTGVTSTIVDNDAVKNSIPVVTGGADGTVYGQEDTVWAVIEADKTSVVEGNKVTYTVKLVDKDNKVVTVSSATDVKIKFTGVTGSEAELNDLLKIFSGDSSSTTEISGGFDSTNKELTITIPNGNSQVQFTIQTKDDFIQDDNEQFNLSISDIVSTEFENLVYDKTKAETDNKTTTTIKDGVTLGTPVNTIVLEDGLNTTSTDNITVVVKGKNYTTPVGTSENSLKNSLGIINPNADTYTVSFDKTITTTDKTSNGQVITYSYNESGTLLTAKRADGKDVFTVELKKDGTNDVYDFKLLEPMDHTYGDNIKDTFDMTFNFNVTSNGTKSDNVPFIVTVVDSVPNATPKTVDTKEDTPITIRLADDNFESGETVKINGTYYTIGQSGIAIYEQGDTTKQIGSLTINTNGTVTFTPSPDYSNHNTTKSPQFTYTVKDYDGDEATSTVTINVKPVADAPVIVKKDVNTTEDAGNTQEGSNKIGLELKVPYLSKDSDRFADTTVTPNIASGTGDQNIGTGDNPERNGEITLTFTNGDKVTGAKIFSGSTEVATINSNNQELKVVIVTETGGDASKIDYTYHHKGTLPAKGGNVLYLTKAEYEALQIQHAEDNDTDIKITIGVTSYEVDDSGKPLNASDSTYTDKTNTDLSKTTTAEMTVKIKAVTDDITLNWDSSKIASAGTLDGTSKVLTFNSITENNSNPKTGETKTENVLDFGSLLTKTSGAGTDTSLDLDGSEKRSYTISLTPKDANTTLPDFIYITIGNQKDIKVNKTGTGEYKLDFDSANNKLENPEFKIKFPDYWSGEVEGTITLRTKDYGVDNDADTTDYSGLTGETLGEANGVKKAEVKFEVKVNPVANLATIEIEQAIGYEDAGRTGGNTTDKNGAITNPENGIPLSIKVTSDDKDSSETFDVTISNLPNNGSLYVKDPITNEFVLITYSNSGVPTINLWNSGTLTTYSSGNILVGNNTVTIKSLTNAKQPDIKFIPAHNDDADFTGTNGFKVNAATTDGTSIKSSTEVTIDVIVKNKADAPVGTDLTTDTSKLITVGGTSYIKATEDTNINLKDIYKTPDNLASYDDSEELTIKIELPTGFTIKEGSPYEIIDVKYVVKADDIKSGKIEIVPPLNFSGNAEIKLTYVTTEKAGENDSKTWNTQTVNIFVQPQADDVNVANSSTIYEDGLDVNGGALNTKVDLSATLKDTGTTNGTETIEGVYISKATIDEMILKGYKLYIDGTELSTSSTVSKTVILEDKSTDTKVYYLIDKDKLDKVTVLHTDTHKVNGDFTLDVAYEVKDTNGASSDTKIYEHTHSVIVKAVTDAPTLTLGTITGTDVTIDNTLGSEKVTVQNGSTSTFTIPVTTTSDDKDNSEKVQEIVISGVPQGVEVENAEYMGYNGSPDNGIWVIRGTNLTDNNLDSDGALQSIKFVVKTGADFEDRPIKITTYTKDEATTDTKVESSSKTFTLIKNYNAGTGTGTPADLELASKTFSATEDTEFSLGSMLEVKLKDGGNTGTGGAVITITDIPEGSKITGYDYSYVEGGKTYYVVSGNGNAADMNTKLSNVKITPPKDVNSSQGVGKNEDGIDLKGDMKFTATIATHHNGTYNKGNKVEVTNTITPVTDEMTVKVEATGTLKEDTPVDLKITLSNPSDATKTELVGNSLTIKINETWKDDATGGVGTKGTLTGDNYNIVESPDGTYTITKKDGTAFTVDTPITGLVYTPATNRDGDVKFEVSVQNKEGNSVALTSKGEANITVKPVIDFVLNNTTVVTNGKEDVAVIIGGTTLANSMKLEFDAGTMTDSSESFGSIVLDKIPNGFTVWYKDTDGTLKMATNIGQIGNGFVLNPNITPAETTHYNQWLVPQIGTGNALPEIYINAPTNWAGEFKFDATFKVKEQQGSFETHNVQEITGKITPVADGVTITPTLTFGDAFSWLDLKLNASMKDIDGSETMSLELTGLSANSQFKIEGGAVIKAYGQSDTIPETEKQYAKWDGAKWTITGIKYDEINKIQFTSDKDVTSVGVNAWTQEIKADGTNVTDTDATSSKVTGSFNVDVKEISGNFTLDKGIDLDFSKLGTSNMKNVTSIDLGTSNGKNEILNLKLSDVLAMTNSSKELIIKGDENDKVTFSGTGWTKGTNDGTYTVYSNDTAKVKIDNNITDITGL